MFLCTVPSLLTTTVDRLNERQQQQSAETAATAPTTTNNHPRTISTAGILSPHYLIGHYGRTSCNSPTYLVSFPSPPSLDFPPHAMPAPFHSDLHCPIRCIKISFLLLLSRPFWVRAHFISSLLMATHLLQGLQGSSNPQA